MTLYNQRLGNALWVPCFVIRTKLDISKSQKKNLGHTHIVITSSIEVNYERRYFTVFSLFTSCWANNFRISVLFVLCIEFYTGVAFFFKTWMCWKFAIKWQMVRFSIDVNLDKLIDFLNLNTVWDTSQLEHEFVFVFHSKLSQLLINLVND